MESTNDEIRELSLLEQIESDPNVNQSALATQLEVAVFPPVTVLAKSEVQNSPLNELNTNFSSVYYKDSNNTWILFDQAYWQEDSPYVVDKTQYYMYHNYGP